MSNEFSPDIIGGFKEGRNLREGLRDAAKKREAEDAYDASRKAAATKIDGALRDAQSAAQAKEDARVSVNNMSGQQLDGLLRSSQKQEPAQKPSVFSEPDVNNAGLRDARMVDKAAEGNALALNGLSDVSPKQDAASSLYAPAGLASANKIATPEIDPHLMRVKQHELTAKYLREKGQYDLADAELDKATSAHDKYLTNTQSQRAQLAGGFARALDSGNIGQATDYAKRLTGMVNDGHDIQSLTPNKDGTFNIVYGGSDAAPVVVTKDKLIELARFFATPDINKHYEEVVKMNKDQSEIAKNNSTANFYNSKANGDATAPKGTSGLTTPQRLKNFEIDKARELTAGLSPEVIKRKTSKFSATGRENPDFDPALESRLSMARKRKYGDDEFFDNQHPESTPDVTPNERFSADPAMKDYKLGSQTPDGKYEVLDASGELVGHYE